MENRFVSGRLVCFMPITSELPKEKAFVAYFRDYVGELRKVYSKVYLLKRKRAEFHLYSFEDGGSVSGGLCNIPSAARNGWI